MISMTMHIDRIAVTSKVGMPKCSGVMTATRLASSRPSNETLPMPIATRVPMMMPSSTAQLATRPRPYLVSSRMVTSVSPAMPRLARSP
ncbi:hypothetical protein D9M70_574370 [compost metagenome]